ncbi:MAG: SMP-30/gluconolactonase/LRE family protein [Bdellovibrionota bacterium]
MIARRRILSAVIFFCISGSALFFLNCGQSGFVTMGTLDQNLRNTSGSTIPPTTTTTLPLPPQTFFDPAQVPVLIGTGYTWAEGPTWDKRTQKLFFSDVSTDRLLTWSGSGQPSVFRSSTSSANGNAMSEDGYLITCEGFPLRRVIKTDLQTGSITVLANSYNGKAFNAPNDLVIHKSGIIYFTDPTYSTAGNLIEQPVRGVYRLDPNGTVTLIDGSMNQPNGIALSPDDSRLYIADTGRQIIYKIDLTAEGLAQGAPSVFLNDSNNGTGNGLDGLAVDMYGNLYSSGANSIRVFNPVGNLLDTFNIGEATTNLTFGGPNNQTIYVVSPSAVRHIQARVSGL